MIAGSYTVRIPPLSKVIPLRNKSFFPPHREQKKPQTDERDADHLTDPMPVSMGFLDENRESEQPHPGTATRIRFLPSTSCRSSRRKSGSDVWTSGSMRNRCTRTLLPRWLV